MSHPYLQSNATLATAVRKSAKEGTPLHFETLMVIADRLEKSETSKTSTLPFRCKVCLDTGLEIDSDGYDTYSRKCLSCSASKFKDDTY